MEDAVWDRYGALATTGAAPIQLGQDIGMASDIEVGRQTLTGPTHTAVAGCSHHDNGIGRAADVERVRKTVLADFCSNTATVYEYTYSSNAVRRVDNIDYR